MTKRTKLISYAIAIVLVASAMTVAIWAATSASATMSASVSWTASAGIEFELEAWAVNNETQNGIGATTVPKSITKQVVTTATSNETAGGLGGNLDCSFYDGTDDGVNNPSSIIYTYKITNTGNTVILLKATKTPNTASESGTTADLHKPAVALSTEIDGVVKGGAVIKVIGSEGYKVQPDSVFEYIVILSIANADISITSFDASVTFSLEASSGTTDLTINREVDLYSYNGVQSVGTTVSGTSATYYTYGAYPQTYVGDSLNSTLKSALNAGTLQSTGKSYTTDSGVANTTSIIVMMLEYYYLGNYYACLESGNPNKSSPQFSTGENIIEGEQYFFKVEPLKWRNLNGTYLCDYAIASMGFSSSGGNLWSGSDVRTWLNEVFYEESGINSVKTSKSLVLNNLPGSIIDGSGEMTEDYLWLPSYSEIQEWFKSDNEVQSDCSDVSKATNIGVVDSQVIYWTRTAGTSGTAGIIQNRIGGIVSLQPSVVSIGIRPCFSL